MEKEKLQEAAFEIILYSGEARNYITEAFRFIKQYDFVVAAEILEKANESLVNAHKKQTNLMQQFAEGKEIEVEIILVHAQDHLMSTMNLKDITEEFFEVYKKFQTIEERVSN